MSMPEEQPTALWEEKSTSYTVSSGHRSPTIGPRIARRDIQGGTQGQQATWLVAG
jgi:hypothetical protein